MKIVDKKYLKEEGIKRLLVTFRRSTFNPQTLCAIEENAKLHHRDLRVLEVSASHTLVVVKFSRPNTEDHILHYLDGHKHLNNATTGKSCHGCRNKKSYCNINPRVVTVMQK